MMEIFRTTLQAFQIEPIQKKFDCSTEARFARCQESNYASTKNKGINRTIACHLASHGKKKTTVQFSFVNQTLFSELSRSQHKNECFRNALLKERCECEPGDRVIYSSTHRAFHGRNGIVGTGSPFLDKIRKRLL